MGNCLSRYASRTTKSDSRNYDDGECAICLESHVTKSQPECGHVFCYECLVDWSTIKMECPTCKPFTEFRHQAVRSPDTANFDQLYRPGPPAAPSASTGRTVRFHWNSDGTFTVDSEEFIDLVINENLVVNNVVEAQALYDLHGIIIAEVERMQATIPNDVEVQLKFRLYHWLHDSESQFHELQKNFNE
uniref:RING-type E3 ubiquitin transferase n=1 Tax=Daphnia galeata TaxID=27404 RepID=A0A8J2RMZ2_9CRUS|nr:unnamed protein product [Daphnia galeata]